MKLKKLSKIGACIVISSVALGIVAPSQSAKAGCWSNMWVRIRSACNCNNLGSRLSSLSSSIGTSFRNGFSNLRGRFGFGNSKQNNDPVDSRIKVPGIIDMSNFAHKTSSNPNDYLNNSDDDINIFAKITWT